MADAEKGGQDRSDAGRSTLAILLGALGDVLLRVPALSRLGPTRVIAPGSLAPLLVKAGVTEAALRLDDPRCLPLFGGGAPGPELAAFLGPCHRRLTLSPRPVPGTEVWDPPGIHEGARFLGLQPQEVPVPWLPIAGPSHGRTVLVPGSGGLRKVWPVARWRELAARLPDAVVVLGPDELERGPFPEEFPGCEVRSPDLEETARLFAGAGVVVGNDAGTSHLAAAVGAPVLALFGPTDPARWRPMGPRVRVLEGMEARSAAEVHEALLAVRALAAHSG